MDRSIAFYTRALRPRGPLGPRGRARLRRADHRRRRARTCGSSTSSGYGSAGRAARVHATPRRRARARALPDAGSAHLCFVSDDLDADVARLQAAGVTFRSLPGRDDERPEHGRSRHLRRGSRRQRGRGRPARAATGGGREPRARREGRPRHRRRRRARARPAAALVRRRRAPGSCSPISTPSALEAAARRGRRRTARSPSTSRSEPTLRRLVDPTVEALGGLDVLVAAAGLYQATPVDGDRSRRVGPASRR